MLPWTSPRNHAYIVGMSNATVQRIFCDWVIFLVTLFNEIDLKLPSGYILKKMPKIFVETGHGLTDLVIERQSLSFSMHLTLS